MKKVVMDVLSRFKYGLALSMVLFTMVATASAQDPPGRAGRLNFLAGAVSFRPSGLDDWAPAEVNLTIMTGDRLWTDSGSRAEMHVGSTALRMASQTDLDVLNIDDETTQLSVSQGSLCVHIHHLYPNEVFEVDTPNAAITLLRSGSYRIDVDSDGHQSRVIVHSGDAEVTSEGSAFPVRPNQLAVIYGTDSLDYDIRGIGAADELDQWCLTREHLYTELAEQHYVSAEMTGYEDLAGYGSWRQDPDAGAVWVPSNVGADWAPYESGHWCWRGYWGWTWVDEAPWGYAPFHYGRWAFIGGYWGWCPGAYIERPFFAPALVAFIGVGAGIGWFPLGLHEAFVPGYHVSNGYFHSINGGHVNVNNIHEARFDRQFANRNVRGAVHGMSQKDFANGHRVAAGSKGAEKFGSGAVTGMHAAVAPNKQGLLGPKGGKAGSPPSSSLHRAVVAKNTPPSVTPFSKQESELKSHPGQPLERQQVATTSGGFQSKSFKSASVSSTGAGLRPARSGITAAHSLSGSRATTTGGAGKGTGSTAGGGGKGTGSTAGGGKGTGSTAGGGGKGTGSTGGAGSKSTGSTLGGAGGKGTGSTTRTKESHLSEGGGAKGTSKGGTLGGGSTGAGGKSTGGLDSKGRSLGGGSTGTGGKSTGAGRKGSSLGGGSTLGGGSKSAGSGSSSGTGSRKTARSTSKGGALGGGSSSGGGSTGGGGARKSTAHRSVAGGGGTGGGATGGGGARKSTTHRSVAGGGGSAGGGGGHSTGGGGQRSTGGGQRSTGGGQRSTGGGGQRSTGGGGAQRSTGGGFPRGGGGGAGGGGGKKKH
jgi:hypothetical protein